MKSQALSQGAERQLRIPPASQHAAAASLEKPAQQLRSSIEDLHEQIAIRAYELYAQRGWREGGALEDWLDAEREVSSRNIFSQSRTYPHQDMES
ncbi:MAG TPA: DUF2934 domain-containing protein [Nitrospiraceae bacterium]|nr:DUF2934 domain-containing protein [Nitrospiraceae bacterium]